MANTCLRQRWCFISLMRSWRSNGGPAPATAVVCAIFGWERSLVVVATGNPFADIDNSVLADRPLFAQSSQHGHLCSASQLLLLFLLDATICFVPTSNFWQSVTKIYIINVILSKSVFAAKFHSLRHTSLCRRSCLSTCTVNSEESNNMWEN